MRRMLASILGVPFPESVQTSGIPLMVDGMVSSSGTSGSGLHCEAGEEFDSTALEDFRAKRGSQGYFGFAVL